MRIHWAFFLLPMLMTTIIFAQEDKKSDSAAKEQAKQATEDKKEAVEEEEEEKKQTIAEKFLDIKNAHSRAARRLRTKLRSASRKERAEIQEAHQEEIQALEDSVDELLAEAKAVKVDMLEAVKVDMLNAVKVDMLFWIERTGNDEKGEKARKELLSNHIDSEELTRLIAGRRTPNADHEATLRRLMTDSPHDSVKAAATMAMSDMLTTLEQLDGLEGARRERIVEMIGEEFAAKWTPEAIEKESDLVLDSLVKNYKDVPIKGSRNGETYGTRIESMIFAKEKLQVGCVAEDIVGEDLDGEEFKLSDYRGKVVVIDFWGDW